MTDPIKPVGAPGVDAAEAVSEAEGAESSSQLERLEGAQGAPENAAVDPLDAAIQEVAADIRAGRVPDAEAASEAVILRLVNLRYAHLGDAQRQKMILHIHEMLHRDPRFLERIERLLEIASAAPG